MMRHDWDNLSCSKNCPRRVSRLDLTFNSIFKGETQPGQFAEKRTIAPNVSHHQIYCFLLEYVMLRHDWGNLANKANGPSREYP